MVNRREHNQDNNDLYKLYRFSEVSWNETRFKSLYPLIISFFFHTFRDLQKSLMISKSFH